MTEIATTDWFGSWGTSVFSAIFNLTVSSASRVHSTSGKPRDKLSLTTDL